MNRTDFYAAVRPIFGGALSQKQLETRVRAVEINQAGQTSDLRAIQVGISEIKAAISKIGDAP